MSCMTKRCLHITGRGKKFVINQNGDTYCRACNLYESGNGKQESGNDAVESLVNAAIFGSAYAMRELDLIGFKL